MSALSQPRLEGNTQAVYVSLSRFRVGAEFAEKPRQGADLLKGR